MVERLSKDMGATKIAIPFQDDAFGRAGYEGVQKAMRKRGLKLAAEGSIERDTVAVKSSLLAIRKGDPDAVIMIGPYKPCAEFITLARKVKLGAKFVNISFVGSNALAKELGADGDGVYVTQVVPFPNDASIPLVARYQAALKASDPEAAPGFVSPEGYITGRLAIEALAKAGAEPTRKGFLETVAANSFDLGGLKLSYGAADNQGSDDVFPTVIQPDGTFKPVTAVN